MHSLCNDVGNKTQQECSNQVKSIIECITKKNTDTKVIISLGLPILDKDLSRKIEKMNILIKEMTSNFENIYLCDNSNVFYRGDAQKGILNEDDLHLARSGTRKLARNMKEALWSAFDISIIVRLKTNQERQNISIYPKESKSPLKNQPQNSAGKITPYDRWNMGTWPKNTPNGQWKEGRLGNAERPSGTQGMERRIFNSYDHQDRDNQDGREQGRQSNRNYNGWDQERQSLDKYGTREGEGGRMIISVLLRTTNCNRMITFVHGLE